MSIYMLCLIALSILAHDLIDVRVHAPKIRIDMRYATSNNFTREVIYKQWDGGCYLKEEVVRALSKVQKDLEKRGLGLLIWDAYRPLSQQWVLWNTVSDAQKKYVADPRKGGRHTRGMSVDCTLVQSKTGKELEMPTEFDDFTPLAWRNCDTVPKIAQHNRKLLDVVMTKYGFIGLPHEWWHFDYKGWEKYPSLDINFDEVKKVLKVDF